MSAARSPAKSTASTGPQLALTTAEVRQVFALYGHPPPGGSPGTGAEPVGAEAPLGALLRGLGPLAWRERRRLALSALAALALGALLLVVATPIHGVRARVLVEQRAAEALAPPEAAAFLAGQTEILAGAPLLREALLRSGLAARQSGIAGRMREWLPIGERNPEDAEREALAGVLEAFSARAVLGTEVIELELRTHDPAGGVRFVQAVIDGYSGFARGVEPGGLGIAVRTLAAPARLENALWPRPLPVLGASLLLGLGAGLGLAGLAARAGEPEPVWTGLREAAWAG